MPSKYDDKFYRSTTVVVNGKVRNGQFKSRWDGRPGNQHQAVEVLPEGQIRPAFVRCHGREAEATAKEYLSFIYGGGDPMFWD